ncbi:hypothetical protein HUO09_17325 [Vibrio sp. Y2-5]|uniref:hypothetical protein n=1 Tax=Vibrio sp. Y2-5 TaxID=2743977 RepID=UPI00166043B2|nr:hypothetical protein [Vibrio sp. Y2-5]MBD0788118.1 hypothetical protein [Vibrio sp. Y2-5]
MQKQSFAKIRIEAFTQDSNCRNYICNFESNENLFVFIVSESSKTKWVKEWCVCSYAPDSFTHELVRGWEDTKRKELGSFESSNFHRTEVLRIVEEVVPLGKRRDAILKITNSEVLEINGQSASMGLLTFLIQDIKPVDIPQSAIKL